MIKTINLTIIIICFISSITSAQIRLTDANGKPLSANKYSEVEGSAYLYNDWKRGSVRLTNGTVYNDIELKIDLIDNQLLFKNSADEMLAFSDPVKEFTLYSGNDSTNKVSFINGYDNSKTFYEVMTRGKCQLLKLHKKTIGEKASYGSSASIKMISYAVTYSIYNNSVLIPIKKDKKSVLSALGNKENDLEAFIKSNNINFKNEEDLLKLINFYNTIN